MGSALYITQIRILTDVVGQRCVWIDGDAVATPFMDKPASASLRDTPEGMS